MEPSLRHNSLPNLIREKLPRQLPEFLAQQRWFGGKARAIQSAEILDVIPIVMGKRTAFLILVRVIYTQEDNDLYALPLIATEENLLPISPALDSISALHLKLEGDGRETILYNAFLDADFSKAVFDFVRTGSTSNGGVGELTAFPLRVFQDLLDAGGAPPDPSLMKAEQSNTSIRYGDRFILKVFRRLEEGINPDLEIGAFLTGSTSFKNIPPLCGALEYNRSHAPNIVVGILQAFVPNQGDAWRYTLASLENFFEKASSIKDWAAKPLLPPISIIKLCQAEFPLDLPELIGSYWDSAALLGRRTAQLHLALASDFGNADFVPEEFTESARRAQRESMRDLTLNVFRILEQRIAKLPTSVQNDAANILKQEGEIQDRFDALTHQKMTGKLIRIHGDFHLGQVLYTGSDFVIIDFEGEPARPLEERRRKRSPVQDVAGMLRSFHYAAYTGLSIQALKIDADPKTREGLERWAQYWQRWVSARFVGEYLKVTGQSHILPQSEGELSILLGAYLLEKAVYELGYELNNRPEWAGLPLRGILDLVEEGR
jgi:maltose alpha-D-glucosyltransferase/alpha-amylase